MYFTGDFIKCRGDSDINIGLLDNQVQVASLTRPRKQKRLTKNLTKMFSKISTEISTK